MRTHPACRFRSSRGFSLIEMLVVISVIAIISAFAIPAFSNLVKGPTLNQASQSLQNQMSLARQYATSKNRSVEVRLLRYADPEIPGEGLGSNSMGQYRAVQLLEVLEAGVPIPLGKIEYFPQTIVMPADARSSLLNPDANSNVGEKSPNATTDPDLPRGIKKNYKFVAFRFLPNGSTNLPPTDNWYISVVSSKDAAANTNLPPNFFTLQIDAVSGTTRGFRPNLK